MKKNLLFLMVDQMHGQVLEKENPCITPNLDKLARKWSKVSKGAYSKSCLLPCKSKHNDWPATS